ncbi:MAG: TolC family protein [Prevotella sp.]|nr:TolC family protein [Prevotella sp.]
MKKAFYILLGLTLGLTLPIQAEVLSLDSCRARALRANKQIQMARMSQEAAVNARKMARTKYLPHIDLTGGYMYSSREISLLNDAQKLTLSNMGTTTVLPMTPYATSVIHELIQNGALSRETGIEIARGLNELREGLNSAGQEVVDALATNTHHIFMASAMLTQPLFMGGAITAGNRIADLTEHMAATNIEQKESDVTYVVDNAYWTVVSLSQKQRLAQDYLALVEKLNADVHKMIKEGVATRADGLKVDVAVNEADMAKTQVDNGLALAKMYLCQQCGMPISDDITLEDEGASANGNDNGNDNGNYEDRRELQMLNDQIEISKQQVKVAKAAYMPQLALTGGAIFTNPSVYNSFERKFKGNFTVGVMLKVPVLDWGENMYKVRMAKCNTNLARLNYDEAHDKIELQVEQSRFKLREANKNLTSATKNIQSAEENLRCANVGFKEGVMNTTDVMAAQTAWMKAHSQLIDANINVILSKIALDKAYGK